MYTLLPPIRAILLNFLLLLQLPIVRIFHIFPNWNSQRESPICLLIIVSVWGELLMAGHGIDTELKITSPGLFELDSVRVGDKGDTSHVAIK